MARIRKTEHPRILEMVDGEHRKVADVAAEYGCTAANIYALLSKLRRDARSKAKDAVFGAGVSDMPSLPLPEDPAPSHESTARSPPPDPRPPTRLRPLSLRPHSRRLRCPTPAGTPTSPTFREGGRRKPAASAAPWPNRAWR